MNVIQTGGRSRMSGFSFVMINLFMCLITVGAWFPIMIIWAICRALSGGPGGNVQVVVANNIPQPPAYQPPPGYVLVPAPPVQPRQRIGKQTLVARPTDVRDDSVPRPQSAASATAAAWSKRYVPWHEYDARKNLSANDPRRGWRDDPS
jgi:hypothetical protein